MRRSKSNFLFKKKIYNVITLFGSIASIVCFLLIFLPQDPSGKTIKNYKIEDKKITLSRGAEDFGHSFSEYLEILEDNKNYFGQKQRFLDESKEKVVNWVGYVSDVSESDNNLVWVNITSNSKYSGLAFFIFNLDFKKMALSLRGKDKVKCVGTIKDHYMGYPILAGHSISIIN